MILPCGNRQTWPSCAVPQAKMVAFNDRTGRCWPESLSRARKLIPFWREEARQKLPRHAKTVRNNGIRTRVPSRPTEPNKGDNRFQCKPTARGNPRDLGRLLADHEPGHSNSNAVAFGLAGGIGSGLKWYGGCGCSASVSVPVHKQLRPTKTQRDSLLLGYLASVVQAVSFRMG